MLGLGRTHGWTCALALGWLSCTFPDITVDGTSASAASSASAGGASSASTTASTGGNPCVNPNKDGDVQDSVACGGQDCNDEDARVFHGQTEFFDEAMNAPMAPGGWYDFDCSGSEEPDPSRLYTTCMAVCSGEGFDPNALVCGTNNGWVECTLLAMVCSPQPASTAELLKCH